jgi:hypothetical protein
MRSICLLLALAACGGAVSEQERGLVWQRSREANTKQRDRALATWRAEHPGLTQPNVDNAQLWLPDQAHTQGAPVAVDLQYPPWLASTETVARDPQSQHVVLAPGLCSDDSTCSCIHYQVFTGPNGHVDLVRLHAVETVQKVHVRACEVGQGTPGPDFSREPRSWFDLAVTSLEQVHVFDVPFACTRVEEVCDKTLKAP